MVGPSSDSLGGISRVVRIWQEGSIFQEHNVQYFSSATDDDVNKFLFFTRSFLSYLYNLISQKSLIYIHTSSFNSFYRKTFFLLPAILTGHDIIIHVHPSHFYDFILSLKGFQKKYTYFILNHVNGFVFLTEEMKKKFQAIYPAKPAWVLRNPVNLQTMKNNARFVRSKNRILFLGWFIPAKGIYELVDAAGLLLERGYDLIVNFYGTKEEERLKKYILQQGLNQNVRVNGWIGHDDKIRVLHESCMLILPSYSEGIPNVILEAMATKTPIVSTLVGGLKELLRDRENAIIVKKKDARDLADKIALCLDNHELRSSIANNAYKEVLEKYEISIIKQKFTTIIDQAINKELSEI